MHVYSYLGCPGTCKKCKLKIMLITIITSIMSHFSQDTLTACFPLQNKHFSCCLHGWCHTESLLFEKKFPYSLLLDFYIIWIKNCFVFCAKGVVASLSVAVPQISSILFWITNGRNRLQSEVWNPSNYWSHFKCWRKLISNILCTKGLSLKPFSTEEIHLCNI